MRRVIALLTVPVLLLLVWTRPAAAATPLAVYGAWHCGDDACIWGTVRPVTEFDSKNHWLVDRGDGRPSVNLVILSFVHPLKLLHRTNDAATVDGIPRGMTPEIVNYFSSRGIRVMLSIGGITYTDAWNAALAENPALFARNAAEVAQRLGVGIEIDYEENSAPNLAALQVFIDTYRLILPYDASGANHAARFTIDTAAGDRWLIALNRKATADWLRTDVPVLDYANAMVPARQPRSASAAIANWQEHVDGKAQFSPPVPPLAPAKLAVSLYIAEGSKVLPECRTFATSLQNSTGSWAQTVVPNGAVSRRQPGLSDGAVSRRQPGLSDGAGTTPGVLGYMFWAAERPSTRGVTTQPPNTCDGGVGAGATAYGIPIPMPALRQA